MDKWVKEALGKIRSKKSVSSFVNGILGTVIKHYDPGPSSPFVYELVKVMEKYREEAEASADSGMLASIAQLHSAIEAYIDLAEAEPEQRPKTAPNPDPETAQSVAARNVSNTYGRREIESYLHIPPVLVRPKKDYYYYAVPILHCEKPMVYLRDEKMWKCYICGKVLHDT